MLIHIILILCFCVMTYANNPILDYVSMEKNDLSVHPLASTYLHEVPPITIEVTPSNDTLINVYFTSTPQPLAILIHLNNSPHPIGTAYSAILITTNPPSEPQIYSGTITFISSVENSTVGFHIPPSANGAVITVDVPTGPLEDPSKTYYMGKTKIRLIQLKSPALTTLQPEATTEPQLSIATTTEQQMSAATTDVDDQTWTPSEAYSTTMPPITFMDYFADDENVTTTDTNFENSTWSHPYTTEPSIEISTATFTEINNITNNNSPNSTEFLPPTTSVPFDSTTESVNLTTATEIFTNSTDDSVDLTTMMEEETDESTAESTLTTPTPFDLVNITLPALNVTEIENETFATNFETFTTDMETFTTDFVTLTTDFETPTIDFESLTTESTGKSQTVTDVFLNNSTTSVSFEDTTATNSQTSGEHFTELLENITSTDSTLSRENSGSPTSFTALPTSNITQLPITIPTSNSILTVPTSSKTSSESTVTPTQTSVKTTLPFTIPSNSTKAPLNSTTTQTPSLPVTVTPIKPIVVNTTCPTVYNIYVNFNLSATFNKTYIKSSPSNKDSSQSYTSQITPPSITTPPIALNHTSLDDDVGEISIPRRIPDITTTVKYPRHIITATVYNTTTSKYLNNNISTTLKYNDTTEKPVFTTTISSSIVNRTLDSNQTVEPSVNNQTTAVSNFSVTSTTTTVPDVNATLILPPTSYWLITVLVAKTDKIDEKFVAEMKESLEKAFDEAFKRQQMKMLGLNSGKKRVKRAKNKFINVEMVNVSKVNSDEVRMIYYLIHNESLIEVNSSLSAMQMLTEQEAALLFGHVVVVKAQPYLQVPTSSSLKIEQSANLLPIILGSVAGFLLIVIIIIVLVKSKCVKRKPGTAVSSPSSSFGNRNRLRAMNDEMSSVIIVEGGESADGRPKLASPNVLTCMNEGMNQPPPLPLKPNRKRRPLPSIPGEYMNIASRDARDTSAELMRISTVPVAQPRTRKNHPLVHKTRAPILETCDEYTLPKSSGVLEYLHAPNSQVPPSVRVESAVVHLMDHQTETEEFDRKMAATQTESLVVADRKISTPEPNSEIDVISSEIHWHSIRQKMQEMIDSAVATLKSTNTSPKFKRNQVQSQPISIISLENPPISVHHSRTNSPEKRPPDEDKAARTAINLHSLLEQNISPTDNLDLTQNYKKPAKDTETEYLIWAIKEELHKFKQNFNTPNPS